MYIFNTCVLTLCVLICNDIIFVLHPFGSFAGALQSPTTSTSTSKGTSKGKGKSSVSFKGTSRYFKKQDKDDKENEKGNIIPQRKKELKEKQYDEPQPDHGYRYHIRIVEPDVHDKRHICTRILRFFPDMNWETAEDIVDTALVERIAVVRILNSLEDGEYLLDMLRKADPPIGAHLYDSKTNEIMSI